MNPDWIDPAVIVIVFIAAVIRSIFGFGEALFAMPLLAALLGIRTATPLVALLAGLLSLIFFLRNWRSAHLGSVWRLACASLAGIPIGLYLLTKLPEAPLRLGLAVGLILFSSLSLGRFVSGELKNEKLAFPFGLMAGVLGGAFNTAGPPVVIYGSLRRWERETFHATLQGYFLALTLAVSAAHAAAGLWTDPVLEYFLLSTPALLLATALGSRLRRAIPAGRFQLYIHGLLLLLGVGLLIQTLRA